LVLSLMMAPESGRSIAPIMCSRVDLPEPEAPVSATNAPASMDRVTLSAAVTWPPWPVP
jgi:hypothetical protein